MRALKESGLTLSRHTGGMRARLPVASPKVALRSRPLPTLSLTCGANTQKKKHLDSISRCVVAMMQNELMRHGRQTANPSFPSVFFFFKNM